MSLCPIVAGSSLTKHKVIRAEQLAERSSAHAVHGTWLQIHEDGPWHVASTSGFVVIDINSLQLEVRVSMICACGVNAMLIGDDFPELSTNLVAALASLNVHDLTHG